VTVCVFEYFSVSKFSSVYGRVCVCARIYINIKATCKGYTGKFLYKKPPCCLPWTWNVCRT